jgi:putative ABC transport system permease protein
VADEGDVMNGVAISLSLVALALVVSRRLRLRLEKELVVSAARALVQLGAVALAIDLVFSYLGLSALLILLMLGAAAWTSSRRLAGVPGGEWIAAASIAAGSAVALVVLFAGRAFPLEPRYLIPIAGMLVGNSMTATSLAGARLRDDVVAHTGEIEVRLALGDTASQALARHRVTAATSALIPTVDATKNVGIVFLPGAFVGMVLGGASPLEAAQVQLVVLFMLLGAVSVAGMVAAILVARAFTAPGDRIVVPVR